MIETRNDVDDGTEKQLVRYQLHNHLGSASLELDGTSDAKVISYEEYHPYGTTAYQAKNKDIKSAAKRYRYTGMERDEETGLEYHSARYYLPWLGRWLNSDPGGLVDGTNLYRYARNNPLILNDPNGMDPPPPSVQPLITTLDPINASANVQLTDIFSSNRSISGRASLTGGGRSSFLLHVPSLSLNTSGILDGSGSANVDTDKGVGQLNLDTGLVLGDLTDLHLVLRARGAFQIPVPGQIRLRDAYPTLLSALPQATGNVTLNGGVQYGNFLLTQFRGNLAVDSGHVSGNIDVNADAPGVSVRGRVTGESNADGSVSISATADLRLLGLRSLHVQGTGSVSQTGANLQGTFAGPGPLYSSYITGDFSVGSSSGVSGSARVLGLTYSPSADIPDPSPQTPGEIASYGKLKNPWNPGGLTLGASWFRYQQGNLDYVSAGFMPDIGPNIISNPRFGITAQFHFNFLGSKFKGQK